MRFIIYTIKEALEGIKANKEAYMLTIGITAISMTILGIFLIVFFNLQGMVNKWRENFQIVVYLNDSASKNNIKAMKKYFASRKEIENYSFVSKDKALEKFKKRLNRNQSILENLDKNPLPASFDLKIKRKYHNYEKIKSIAEEVNKLKGIESLEFGEGWLEKLETVLYFLKFIVFGVGGLIYIGVIFIISSTMKLSLYARKDEIEVMQLVGATDWYVKGPFLLEGMFQAFIGALICLAILSGLHKMFIAKLQTSSFFIGAQSFLFLPPDIINYIIVSGILIGFLGSFISLRKFLNS